MSAMMDTHMIQLITNVIINVRLPKSGKTTNVYALMGILGGIIINVDNAQRVLNLV